jgi:anti-sigma factor RsiW
MSAMHCRDLHDLIEPIAAGDRPLDDEARAHIESCPSCAAALASARRLESALAALETPPTPASFTATVLQRIRRDSWQSEQRVDQLFNVAIVAAVLLVVGGIVAMLNVDALFSLSASTWVFAREGVREALHQAAPTVATYVAAAGLLASGLGMWWWAERKLQY